MSWTHNDVEMLIENVQKHPCLYKVRDVIYKNKHARNSAWESILNEMKTFRPSSTLLELKTKFRGLKCSFNQEYKKAMFKKSGSGTDDLYTPTLWYYEKLLFLQDNVMPRSAYVDSIEIENVEDDVFNDSFENFTQGEDIGLNFENTQDEEVITEALAELNYNKPKTGRKKTRNEELKRTDNIIHEASNILNRVSQNLEIVPCTKSREDAFGEFIASRLKLISNEEEKGQVEAQILKIFIKN